MERTRRLLLRLTDGHDAAELLVCARAVRQLEDAPVQIVVEDRDGIALKLCGHKGDLSSAHVSRANAYAATVPLTCCASSRPAASRIVSSLLHAREHGSSTAAPLPLTCSSNWRRCGRAHRSAVRPAQPCLAPPAWAPGRRAWRRRREHTRRGRRGGVGTGRAAPALRVEDEGARCGHCGAAAATRRWAEWQWGGGGVTGAAPRKRDSSELHRWMQQQRVRALDGRCGRVAPWLRAPVPTRAAWEQLARHGTRRAGAPRRRATPNTLAQHHHTSARHVDQCTAPLALSRHGTPRAVVRRAAAVRVALEPRELRRQR